MAEFKMQLLGRFELRHKNEIVSTFRTKKTRILLAYLALNANTAVGRKTLAGLFWPESPADRAAHNLRQALSFLRQALNIDKNSALLKVSRQEITFNLTDQIFVDALDFDQSYSAHTIEQFEKGIQLYQGTLLDGVFIDDSPEFELWLNQTREQYHIKALTMLERLADFHLEQGRYERAKQFLMHTLELAPWHEAGHRGLMRTLALAGDSAGALMQYEKCCHILETELAVSPLPVTQQLAEQIRSGTLDYLIRPSLNGQIRGTPSPHFVGRAAEHGQLSSIFANLTHSPIHTILVEGEVGSGKTRLIEEFNRFAQSQGATVLKGRCFEFGETVAYQPIVEAMQIALKMEGVQPSLSAVWLAELSRLLPELYELHPDLPEPHTLQIDSSGSTGRQRLFSAVHRFLQSITTNNHPLILFLDDLHWADGSTIDLLHYLIRQNQEGQLLVLGAYRPEETPSTHPLTILRRGLSRDRLVHLIQLNPLKAEDIQEVVLQLSEKEFDPEFSHFLHQESEGNPFVLTEVLNTLYESNLLKLSEIGQWQLTSNWQEKATKMTASLRDTILNRVERLPNQAQALLKIAAVIGRTFESDLLKSFDQNSVDGSLTTWLERRLVRSVTSTNLVQQYDFAHDKIREVVYYQLPIEQRQALHGQVGEKLEQQSTKQPSNNSLASAIAHHYYESSSPMRAIPFLLTAAQQAQLALAFTTVVHLCTQALELDPADLATRFELLRLRQLSYEYLGDWANEEVDVLEMLDIAEKRQDTKQAMMAQKRLSIFYMHRDAAKAQQIINRTLRLYQAAGDKENESETLLIAAVLHRNLGETEQAFELFKQSRDVAREIGNKKSEGFSMGYVALEQIRRGELSAAAKNYQQGGALIRATHRQSVELGYHLIGTTNLYRILGQYQKAAQAIEESWQIGSEIAHMGIQCWCHLQRGKSALWQESFADAKVHYQQAQTVATAHQYGILLGHAHWGLGLVALAENAYQAAIENLTIALTQFTDRLTDMVIVTHAYLGLVYARLHDYETALKHSQQISECLIESGHSIETIVESQQICLCQYHLLLAANRPDEAERWLAEGKSLVISQAKRLDEDWREAFVAIPVNQALLNL